MLQSKQDIIKNSIDIVVMTSMTNMTSIDIVFSAKHFHLRFALELVLPDCM